LSRHRRAWADDAGVTMIDVIVAMTLMSVFMGIFTGVVMQMFRSANDNQVIASAQTQLTTVFLRLDKEIRYAAGISTPGLVGDDSYVEYRTVNTGTPMCTELRLNIASGQLQRRTWSQDVTPPAPTGWIPLASEVSSSQPFTFWAPDSDLNFQRLQLTLDASGGPDTTAVSRSIDVTFTALNTTLGTDSATDCLEGRALP
jgi:Tfp pilus assembly protein PilV